jgi:hypothetical protein
MRLAFIMLLVMGGAAVRAEPIVDGPAAPGAVEQGRALIKEGEALALEGKLEQALVRFLEAASRFPSARHDCYAALGSFRLGRLTAARLHLDVARHRGDALPDWCAQTLPGKLGAELTRRGYLRVAVKVTPAEAVVRVGDAEFAGGRDVWLPPGEAAFEARHEGFAPFAHGERIASEGQLVDVELSAVVPAPAQVAAAAAPPPEASVRDTPTAAPDHGWRTAGIALITGGGAALAAGVIFHVRAGSLHDQANDLFTDDPRYAATVSDFETARALAIGGYVVGAAAVAVGIGLLWHRSPRSRATVSMTPGRTGGMVSLTFATP